MGNFRFLNKILCPAGLHVNSCNTLKVPGMARIFQEIKILLKDSDLTLT